MADGRSTPSEGSVLRSWGRMLKAEVRVSLLGTVTAYEPTSRMATVQPIMASPDGVTVPPLQAVRVGQLSAGPFVISMPVKAGDTVEVTFLDYDHDAYLANGDEGATPSSRRSHNLSDAVCMPVAMSPDGIAATSADHLVIGLADDSATITLHDDGRVDVKSEDIRLGSSAATDPLILLAELRNYITDLNTALSAAVAPGGAGGVLTFGTALPIPASVTGASKVGGE